MIHMRIVASSTGTNIYKPETVLVVYKSQKNNAVLVKMNTRVKVGKKNASDVDANTMSM